MIVADVMSKKIATVSPGDAFKEVWRIIFKHKINSLPVIDKKKRVVGLITRRELLGRLFPDYQDLFSIDGTFPDFEDMEKKIAELGSLKAEDLMRKRVVFTHEYTPIMRALSRMIVRRVNQLPVVTKDEKLLGVVTKGDIFYSLFKKNLRKR